MSKVLEIYCLAKIAKKNKLTFFHLKNIQLTIQSLLHLNPLNF
jgi:hypothetical protein